ncbi:MAG: DUF4160 domain-containing protein [Polyangiaceae bacterium]|nr:DUF4160 domain-containing protein [Polyangiaceae bacterium]
MSVFFGITIRVYFEDHAPPHIHVAYAEFNAVVGIDSGEILAGQLPKRCAKLVEEWRIAHLAELRKAWKTTQSNKIPKRIAPLS